MSTRMTRREMLRYVGLGSAVAVLAACAPKVVEKVVKETVLVVQVVEPTKAAPPEVIPLILSDWPDDWAIKCNGELIDRFQEDHPGTQVTYFPLLGYDLQKLTTMMAGGVAPDIFTGWGTWFRTWAEKGQIVSLDPYIDLHRSELDIDDFYEGPLEGMRAGEQQVALTKYVNPVVLFYNKDMFDEAALEYPNYDWTWDDWREAAIKLTKREGNKTTQWGLWVPVPSTFSRDANFVRGNCGDFWDKNDPTHFTFDSPEAVEGLQFLHDLIWKDKVAPLGADFGGLSDPFTPGVVAMGQEIGNQFFRWIGPIADKFQWDGTLPPKGKCGRGIEVSLDGYMIYSGTRYPDLAWDLLMLMVSKEAAVCRYTEGGLAPGRRSCMPGYQVSQPEFNLKTIADAMEEARPIPSSAWAGGNATKQIVAPFYEQAFVLNKISVEEAMTKAVAAIHEQKPWEA